jgi:hypothetical protein
MTSSHVKYYVVEVIYHEEIHNCALMEEIVQSTKSIGRKSKGRFPTAVVGMALCCALTAGEAQADEQCGPPPATYFLTVLNSDGSFASRQVFTLTEDGNVVVGDSAQGGVTGAFNPFTTAQGTWECGSRSSPTQANATTLDFSLPGSVSGRADHWPRRL